MPRLRAATLFTHFRGLLLSPGPPARGHTINGTLSPISPCAFGRAESNFLFAAPGLTPWANLFRRLRRLCGRGRSRPRRRCYPRPRRSAFVLLPRRVLALGALHAELLRTLRLPP